MANRKRGFHSPARYLIFGIGVGFVLVGFWAANATPVPGPCTGPFACTYAPNPAPQPTGLFLLYLGGSIMLWWALILLFDHLRWSYVPSPPPATLQSR